MVLLKAMVCCPSRPPPSPPPRPAACPPFGTRPSSRRCLRRPRRERPARHQWRWIACALTPREPPPPPPPPRRPPAARTAVQQSFLPGLAAPRSAPPPPPRPPRPPPPPRRRRRATASRWRRRQPQPCSPPASPPPAASCGAWRARFWLARVAWGQTRWSRCPSGDARRPRRARARPLPTACTPPRRRPGSVAPCATAAPGCLSRAPGRNPRGARQGRRASAAPSAQAGAARP